MEHLGMLADDAEARGARREAAARHEDRIEAAAAAASARAGVLKQLIVQVTRLRKWRSGFDRFSSRPIAMPRN